MTKPTLVPRTSPEHPSCARQPPTAASPPAVRARAGRQQLPSPPVQVLGKEQTPLKQGSARETLSCSLHGLAKLGALETRTHTGDRSKKSRLKDAAPAGGVREGAGPQQGMLRPHSPRPQAEEKFKARAWDKLHRSKRTQAPRHRIARSQLW